MLHSFQCMPCNIDPAYLVTHSERHINEMTTVKKYKDFALALQ